MISVYENETNVHKKRYLLRYPTYKFVTISGAEKAYTFYKSYCDHVVKALIMHDGSNAAMTAKKNDVNLDITQLNDLTNSGIRYALAHSWEDFNTRGLQKKTIIILPSGLRGFASFAHRA